MLKGSTFGAVAALALMVQAAHAAPSPAPRPERGGPPAQPEVEGATRANPVTSPRGLLVTTSPGHAFAINARPAEGTEGARVRVSAGAPGDEIVYSASANLSDEGIQADLGRFGQIHLRWQPSGKVREVVRECGGLRRRTFFAQGAYVGTVHLSAVGDDPSVTAHRIPWSPRWYPPNSGCPFSVSEGRPGPGSIFEAVHRGANPSSVYLTAIQNGAGDKVTYEARQSEEVGRISVSRELVEEGGATSVIVAPGYRTGEISPPAPFSGSARFERVGERGAKGTWLGDLSVEFFDGLVVPLSGKSFEARLYSGYREIHEP